MKASAVLPTLIFAAVITGVTVSRKTEQKATPAALIPVTAVTVAPRQTAAPTTAETPRSALIREAVAEINKSAPMMVDKSTQLQNAVGLGDAIVYRYKLLKFKASEVDPDEVRRLLYASVKTGVCSTPSTRNGVLGNGITMRYMYLDMFGAYITAFEVTPRDCGLQ